MAKSADMEGKTPQPSSGGSMPLPKSKRGPKAFFSDVMRELKKVTWPSKSETNRMTGVVLAVCALIVLILTGLNIAIDTLFRIITQGQV